MSVLTRLLGRSSSTPPREADVHLALAKDRGLSYCNCGDCPVPQSTPQTPSVAVVRRLDRRCKKNCTCVDCSEDIERDALWHDMTAQYGSRRRG